LTRDQSVRMDEVVPLETSPHQAAHALVAAGLLTKFQAGRLLAGKANGFHVGPYIIQEKVGDGAMGKVFRAKHRTMQRAVAVKVLSSEMMQTPDAREVIQRAVRAAAQLNHANIVTAYDSNELGEHYYLVLEYVDGPNLESLVRKQGPLPISEACELIRQAALGLAHAHSQGMLHLNIKPSNLLIASKSVLKIADFGIAKLSPSENRDFIAPEQAHYPQLADARADLYSLGAVFYFLLTGRTLFPKGTPDETVERHMFDEPFRVERLRSEVPAPVAALVHQLLAKQPDARPASASDVAARLGALMGVAEQAYLEVTPGPIGSAYGAAPDTVSFSGSDLHPVVSPEASETSPWEHLTVATRGLHEPETQSWDFPRAASLAPRRSNSSRGMIVGLSIGLLLAGVIVIGALTRAMGN
jgi:serine/threonine-protein kinase